MQSQIFFIMAALTAVSFAGSPGAPGGSTEGAPVKSDGAPGAPGGTGNGAGAPGAPGAVDKTAPTVPLQLESINCATSFKNDTLRWNVTNTCIEKFEADLKKEAANAGGKPEGAEKPLKDCPEKCFMEGMKFVRFDGCLLRL